MKTIIKSLLAVIVACVVCSSCANEPKKPNTNAIWLWGSHMKEAPIQEWAQKGFGHILLNEAAFEKWGEEAVYAFMDECEKIGLTGAITHKRPGKETYETDYPMPTHNEAIELVLKLLTDAEWGVIKSVDEIGAVGHRFAHGGKFQSSQVLTEAEMEYLESIVPINPLHGPPAIKGVYACRAVLADKPHVGVFDTSFYSTLEPKAYMYALPYEWYEKYGIRKYGFHGTSHRYVGAKAAEYLGKDIKDLKIITCHIGSGSSVTAIDGGIAVDTSMGFTPQDGLPMGTRCGAIDPSLVTYVMKQSGMTPDEMDNAMNKKSGLEGVSGVSSDCRDIEVAAEQGDEKAKLVLDMYFYQLQKFVGSYTAAMNGLDVMVFTAGIGENSANVREGVCEGLGYFGVEIDKEKNKLRGLDVNDITGPNSKVKVLVVATNEELMIARDTVRLLGL